MKQSSIKISAIFLAVILMFSSLQIVLAADGKTEQTELGESLGLSGVNSITPFMVNPEQSTYGDIVTFGLYPQRRLGFLPPRDPNYPAVGEIYVVADDHKDPMNLFHDTIYIAEPLEWSVLANEEDYLLLITKDNIEASPFNSDGSSAVWNTSAIKTLLDGMLTKTGIISQSVITGGTNTTPLFSTTEQGAVKRMPEGKVYPLSVAEAESMFPSDGDRKAINTAYTASYKNTSAGSSNDNWWLRTAGSFDTETDGFAAYVQEADGKISFTGGETEVHMALRPALRLDKSKILLLSDIAGKPGVQNSFVPMAKATNSKLTLVDTTISTPSVTVDTVTPVGGANLTITATAEVGYTLGAILELDGEVKYYSPISGTGTIPVPNDPGEYVLKVFNEKIEPGAATDTASEAFTTNLTVTPNTPSAPIISTSKFDKGLVGTPYNFTLNAIGNPAITGYTFTTLPAGLSNSAGVISGTPTTPGDYNVTVSVTNGSGTTTTVIPFVVEESPSISTTTLPDVEQGGTYNTTIAVAGYPNPIISVSSGSLPTGLSLDPTTGVISGVPTIGSATPVTFIVSASNGVGAPITQMLSILVKEAVLPSIVQPPAGSNINETRVLSAVKVGETKTYTFEATGVPKPIISNIGGTLPPGMTFAPSATSGQATLSGTPTTAGIYTFDIKADNGTAFVGATISLEVKTDGTAPVITTTTLPVGGRTLAYNEKINVTGTPNPTFTFDSGTLPNGLTLALDGTISGTPTTVGISTFTVTAANGVTPNASQSFTLEITNPKAPSITTTTISNPVKGSPYSAKIEATGVPANIQFSATGLPAGLSINSTTGEITGTPTVVGNFNFTVTAANTIAPNATMTYSMTVADISITSTTLPVAEEGKSYSAQIEATGTPSPNFFVISSGVLPTGLTLDANTGKITGTPTPMLQNSYTFEVSISNGIASLKQMYTMNVTIKTFVPQIQTTVLKDARVGIAYTDNVVATGSPTPKFSISSGALPAGLTLDNITGEISGIPTAQGSYNITVDATNSGGVAKESYTIVVSDITMPTVSTNRISLVLNESGNLISSNSINVSLGNYAKRADISYPDIITGSTNQVVSDGTITLTPAVQTGHGSIEVKFYDSATSTTSFHTETILTWVESKGSANNVGSGNTSGGGGGGNNNVAANTVAGKKSTSSYFQGDNSPNTEQSVWNHYMNALPAAIAKSVKEKTEITRTKIRNANSITINRAKTIVADSKKDNVSVRIHADTVNNNKVDVRISFNPDLISKELKLYGSINNNITEQIAKLFEKIFGKNIRVVYFGEQGEAGQRVEVAAKVNLEGLNTDTLVFYNYDKKTNTYNQLKNVNYSIDANGYLHFYTETLMTIIISDGSNQK